MKKKILVIGAGAIGGIIAGILKTKGYDVFIICKYNDYADIINKKGLTIKGIKGQYTNIILPAYINGNILNEKFDIILHATKAYDVIDTTKSILHLMHENSYIVSLQNGICEEAIASIVGRDKVIGAVVGWGATMHTHGDLEITSKGEFVIGNIDNNINDPRLIELKNIFENIYPVYISNNIFGYLYSKLILNSCTTSLGVIGGKKVGEMLKFNLVRNIFIKIIYEAVSVSEAINIRIEPYSGKFDYYKFIKGTNFLSHLRRHFIIIYIGYKYRRLKSSSLQSIERGGKTEIDYLNGYIVSKAKEANIKTPVNELIVKIVKEIEEGKRKIGIENYKIFKSLVKN